MLNEVKRKGESRSTEENINTSTDNNKVNENRIYTSTMHTGSIDVDQKFEKTLACKSNNSSNKTISSKIVDIKPVLTDVEIPVFLRKIYHMFNTCDDPTVCSWSEDGTMIVVKNVSKFENDIIPQFFKHNKFTSFVRQLNFYGFRKINNINNSIRIDAPTEKNWRFYHPKFQHNRTYLLKQMKRSPIKKKEKKTEQLTTTTTTQSVGITNDNVVKGTTIDDDEIKGNGDHQLHNTTTTTTTTVTPINIRPPASPPPPSHLLQSNNYSGDNNNEGDLLFGEYYDSDCKSTDSDLVF